MYYLFTGGDLVKRILVFITLISLMTGLYGCFNDRDDNDYVDYQQFTVIHNEINDALPLYFNQDILLPQFDDAEVTWKIDDQSMTTILLYQPPIINKETEVHVDITIDDTTISYTFPMIVLAPDSALNQNVMRIEVDIPIEHVTKETYRNAAVHVDSVVNGELHTVFENNQVEIRGRGNSTWGMPKKPYRLKFADDVSILGMPAARNYVLLAEYADKSLLRNTIAYKFSGMLENIEHAASTRVVEVYFNGAYHGVYTLTEHMEVHENKLFIGSNPGHHNTGYFMELDQRFDQHGKEVGVDGIRVAGIPYVFKEPTPHDDLTSRQVEFMDNYIRVMENTLIHKDGYEYYMDVDNFIDYFIVQELFKNVDVGWGSVFFYKRPNEVLRMGPIWDFDLAMGNANYIDYGPENWYGMRNHKNRWFQLMMGIPDIRDRFKARYIELYSHEIPLLLEAVGQLGNAMIPLAERNFTRWDRLGHYDWPNPHEMVEATTYQEQVDYLYHYIKARADWMYYAVQSENYAQGIFD